MLQI
ncbi:hypothetical protein D023_1681A, partial [Vibrio parahaemolyticus 3256]|jgi:hypothetical protein